MCRSFGGAPVVVVLVDDDEESCWGGERDGIEKSL